MSLHKAVIDGMTDVVAAILQRGEDPNQRDEDTGRTVAHCAAQAGNVQMLQLLKEYGADWSLVDYNSNTPLSEAVENGKVEVVKWLLSNLPRDGNVVTDMLFVAAACGQVQAMTTLLAHGASILSTDDLGRDALFHAAVNGQSRGVSFLLQNGANPATCDHYKKTLLHAAAESGDLETIKLVLKQCKDTMQERDIAGDTPLHCAATTTRAAVALFLDQGVSVDIKNGREYTALDLAKQAKNTEVVDLLRDVIYQFDELTKGIKNL